MKKLLTITILTIAILTMKVNASTITPSSTLYMSLWCSGRNCTQTEAGATATSGWITRGTAYNAPSGAPWLMQMKMKTTLTSGSYLQANIQYLVQFKINLVERQWEHNNSDQWRYEINYIYSDNTTGIYENYVVACRPNTNNTYEIICTMTLQPTKAVKDFTFRIYFPFGTNDYIILTNRVNYTNVIISGGDDTQSAINNQTIIIQEGLSEIQESLDRDHTYNNNPSDNTQEEEEELQEDLWEMLDFDISDLEIGINPNASSYIWTIINQLRGINAKIVVLMTAILGLGIVKMILNR